MRTLKWIFLFFPLIIAACSKQAPIERPPPRVITQTIKTQNIPFFIDTLGHFVAFNTVNVQAQVQGVLTGLYFEEGQSVKAGDLLFTIDKAPYQAVLNKAIATLKENQATLAYNLSRQERYSGLVEENYVSKLQYTQYVTELESQQALIEANKADIESAAINVGFCSLFSPIDGVTGKRLIDVGNVITDVGSKLLVINQITPLFIDFSIPERYFDLIQRKQKEKELLVEIYVPNTSLSTQAWVQMIDNTINSDTGMIGLRGILPNEDQNFWPQQFVRIRLIMDTIENAVMAPTEAIVSTSQGEMVWVVDNQNVVHPTLIETGEEYNNHIQVLKGLKSGQKVVTKGQLPLKEGIKVSVESKESESNS